LAEASVSAEVLTTTANGAGELPAEIVDEDEFEGVPVHYLPRGFPRRLFRPRCLGKTLRERLDHINIVHVHGLWNWPVWAAVRECRRVGLPYVVSPRGMLDRGSFSHHRWRKSLGYWAWEKRYLRTAALLHATSVEERHNVERLSLGPEVIHVPNGVTTPDRTPAHGFRREVGIGEKEPLVLFLGRLHPTKRLDLLLSAVEKLREGMPRVRLVLAGPEDGLEANALIGERSAEDWVSWVGPVATERKWALLSEANVLALCSDSESFGMSVVEAMAVGTPVVVTRTCPWEEVEARGTGFWVDQRAEAVAEGLSRILGDPVEARAMGVRGRELVRARYQWCAIGRAMAAHYARVLSARLS